MTTDAQRKASATFHAKRSAEGWRKVTLWMHPDTVAELGRLGLLYGSKERAVAVCLSHHAKVPDLVTIINDVILERHRNTDPVVKAAVPYGSRLKKR